MQQQSGEMWDVLADRNSVVFVTGNGTIKKDGSLVMGAGAAKEAALKFRGLSHAAGHHLRALYKPLISDQSLYEYNLLSLPDFRVGLFQSKLAHWSPSELLLIRRSAKALATRAEENPEQQFHCNMPGVGCGGLRLNDVLPMLESLPDNVTFWTKVRTRSHK